MKLLIIIFALSLTGCAQLMKGEMQPVKMLDAKQQIYFTTCSGTVEEWGSCNRKARETCANGYETLEKVEKSIGGKRELKFRCK
jgi:hypothetical protein